MRLRGSTWLLVLALLVAACRGGPAPPRLADALQGGGGADARAKTFLRVAVLGSEAERARAAFLWGVFACDAGSAQAATVAFALAAPRGGLGRLAARRLEGALSGGPTSEELWREASASAWLENGERAELRVAGAEQLAGRGEIGAALRLLPREDSLDGELRLRALAVMARVGGEARAVARRVVACDFPGRFADLFPNQPVADTLVTLSPDDRLRRAEAWLHAGRPEAALREAAPLGRRGALVAARAALQMRRPQTALLWAERGGADVESRLVQAEAYRASAWAGSGPARREGFLRMRAAAAEARRLAGGGTGAMARATLLEAEALTELGRFSPASALLGEAGVTGLPRWEWVWRRLIFLQGQRGEITFGLDLAPRSSSVRDTRLAAFWKAVTSGGVSRASQLDQLAGSGFPDLPALWAARRLDRNGVPVTLGDAPPGRIAPPPWASDLMTLGRVGDVVVAWRAALQAGLEPAREWLGLVQLADYPAIDTIPLLLRGEPRLLAGPWSGLPRSLLEIYLPLPWRSEVEEAAREAGVPPWVLAGVVRQESAWNPRARSPAGALGLTQVLPGTAREIARRGGQRDLERHNLFDPATNLALGALHLQRWFSRYHSWTVALACHNAGERRVREAWQEAGRTDGPEFVESLEIPETWDYVHRVVVWAEGYRLVYWPQGRPYPWTSSR